MQQSSIVYSQAEPGKKGGLGGKGSFSFGLFFTALLCYQLTIKYIKLLQAESVLTMMVAGE